MSGFIERLLEPERLDCPLCTRNRQTHLYAETDLYWVADCPICAVPLVAWKLHDTQPSSVAVVRMLNALLVASFEFFEGLEGTFWFDGRMVWCPGHWHVHARHGGKNGKEM